MDSLRSDQAVSLRRLARAGLIAYLIVGLMVLLQPHPTIASSVVGEVWETLIEWGASPAHVTPARVEALVNAAMFMPPAALAVIVIPRLRWLEVVALGFIASLGVEVVQALVLEARSAQAVDLASNASGGLVGAGVGAVARWSTRVRGDR